MPDQYKPYYETKHADQEEKLKKVMDELPEFTTCFFRELSRFENKAASTLIAYAMDLKVFTWAKGFIPFKNKPDRQKRGRALSYSATAPDKCEIHSLKPNCLKIQVA